MFEITVKALGLYNNIVSHSEVKIKDMANPDKCYIISINPSKIKKGTNSPNKIKSFDSNDKFFCVKPEKITLYSNRDTTLENFINEIEEQCSCEFNICFNNCSDAAQYALNYFFPRAENLSTEAVWQAYKFITFPFCIATLGCTPFFGAPPLVNAPYDIYRKAQLLSLYYSKPEPFNPELQISKKSTCHYGTF